MQRAIRRLSVVFVLGLVLTGFGDVCLAQHQFPWMRSSPGVRSLGIGATGGAFTDPFVSFYNPGGLGVYLLNARVGVSRTSTSKDLTFNREDKSTYITFGLPLWDISGSGSSPRLAVGAAYHKRRAGIRDVELTDGTTQDFIDRYTNYTVAVAAEYGAAIGAGFSSKYAWNSVSWERESGYDIGVYVDVPIFRTLALMQETSGVPRLGPFAPEVSATVAYTWANRNKYEKGLPTLDLFGRSVTAELQHNGAMVVGIMLTRDDLDDKWDRVTRRQGWELDMLGIVQIRRGSYWTGSRDHRTTTSGESFYLQGLVQWIGIIASRTASDLPWYVRSIDAVYHTASWETESASFFGVSKAKEFGVYLDIGSLLE